MSKLTKQDIDTWLDQVNYSELNSNLYLPSEFSLMFLNFIKLVNGSQGESNKTPPFHLKMLDRAIEPYPYIVNLCFRGAAKALDVDTKILTTKGWTTIYKLRVGDYVYSEEGKPTLVTHKSEVFHKAMFRINLEDGRHLDVSEDHINSVYLGSERKDMTTFELLNQQNPDMYIPLGLGIDVPDKKLCTDPYIAGSLLSYGSKFISVTEYKDASIPQKVALLSSIGSALTVPYEQQAEDIQYIVNSLGGVCRIRVMGGFYHLSFQVPYLLNKRGVVDVTERIKLRITSIQSIREVPSQCIAVDNPAHTFLAGDFITTHNTTVFMEYFSLFLATFGKLPKFGLVEGMLYISDSMDNGVKSARKNIEYRYNNSDFLQEWIPEVKFTDNYLEFVNKDGHRLGIKMFGALTGLRGTKIFGKRPVLAVLDDLIHSDADAASPTIMDNIKDTIYKGVNHALDPIRRKVILNGTPFNKQDVMVTAVESGAWQVNVWPVCEKFPCTEDQFVGAWPDRFSFEYIKSQYDLAVSTGKASAFFQELMLRISSEEERLIQDADIKWYDRSSLLKTKEIFNFYITTDFAVSDRKTADNSVISVWAYNSNGDWFWVDGICVKQTIDLTIDSLFRLVQEYKPQQVGIEATAQQAAFIKFLDSEMLSRNIWFSYASSEKGGRPGIRPTTNKLTRLNVVVPWFKAGKMFFPTEMRHSVIMGQFMQELRLVTMNSIRGSDDCLDTISMLGYLTPWKPSESLPMVQQAGSNVFVDPVEQSDSALSSYIV